MGLSSPEGRWTHTSAWRITASRCVMAMTVGTRACTASSMANSACVSSADEGSSSSMICGLRTSARDPQALALPAGQQLAGRADIHVENVRSSRGVLVEAQRIEQRTQLLIVNPVWAAIQQVVAHRAADDGGLLRYEADQAPYRVQRIVRDRPPAKHHPARTRREQAGQQTEKGGFARPRGTDDGIAAPFGQVQVESRGERPAIVAVRHVLQREPVMRPDLMNLAHRAASLRGLVEIGETALQADDRAANADQHARKHGERHRQLQDVAGDHHEIARGEASAQDLLRQVQAAAEQNEADSQGLHAEIKGEQGIAARGHIDVAAQRAADESALLRIGRVDLDVQHRAELFHHLRGQRVARGDHLGMAALGPRRDRHRQRESREQADKKRRGEASADGPRQNRADHQQLHDDRADGPEKNETQIAEGTTAVLDVADQNAAVVAQKLRIRPSQQVHVKGLLEGGVAARGDGGERRVLGPFGHPRQHPASGKGEDERGRRGGAYRCQAGGGQLVGQLAQEIRPGRIQSGDAQQQDRGQREVHDDARVMPPDDAEGSPIQRPGAAAVVRARRSGLGQASSSKGDAARLASCPPQLPGLDALRP